LHLSPGPSSCSLFVMDEIQRKLALIDEQLAGRNLHRQIISTCPLVFVAAGLIGGILIQSRFAASAWIWMVLLALFAAATVVVFCIQQFSSAGHRPPLIAYQYVAAYLALACFVCLGAIRLAGFCRPAPNDIRNLVADERKLATIRGMIVTEPYISKYPDWKFAGFKFTDPSGSFYLRLDEVQAVGGWAKVTGTVRVQVDEPVLDLKAGDQIQAYCWLERFKPATNPGQFDIAEYLARRNVFIGASVKSRDGIKLLKRIPAGSFAKLKTQIRQAATKALLGDLPDEDASRGLLQALLLGYRQDIDRDTYRAFRKTGLLHFISLSGMHLGILVGIIWWLCKTVGFMKPARAMICAIAVGVFLLIVPPRAPTIRAAIICWVFCGSIFFRRHANPINTLALAAMILLLARPTQLFEAGWQLSFASVLGIILFTERIETFICEHALDRFGGRDFLKSRLLRAAPKSGSFLLRLFAVGFAAWLCDAGILLYHFHTITPLASIWTVLVFPLVSAILTLGFLKMIMFFVLPTLSTVLAVVTALLSDLLVWAVKLIAQLDISQILIGHVPVVIVVLYYCIVVFAGFAYLRRPLAKKTVVIAALLAIVAYLGVLKWQRTHRDNLVITCLDVGHGQAILAQLPGRANILFDAGSLHKSDIGTRIVAPFLDWKGISRIDAIIVSHNDTDHINGIPEVAGHCKLGAVYANDDFFDKADEWGTAKFLSDSLDQMGLEIERLDKTVAFGSEANIKTLWPDNKTSCDDQLSDNDKSLVSLIEFAGTKVLLCSDIEQFAQRELLRLHPDLKADVVVVPHHGSANTLEPEFLQRLNAKVHIYSCGRSEYERTDRAPALVTGAPNRASFYTHKHGAITVRVGKDGMIQSDFFRKKPLRPD
jgi:competence protein ComEC